MNQKPLQIGCYVDGGHHTSSEGEVAVVGLAAQHGMAEVEWDFDPECDDLTDDQREELTGIAEEAEDFLNDMPNLPPYTSWGWQDGDFGLWPSIESLEEDARRGDDVLKVEDIPSFLMHVNDHGNVTLYSVEVKEVWGCV